MYTRTDISTEEIKLADEIVKEIFNMTKNHTVLSEVVYNLIVVKGIKQSLPMYEMKHSDGSFTFMMGGAV